MDHREFVKNLRILALALVFVILMAVPSFAAVYNLAAVEAEWTPPGGGTPITMWGFIQGTACPTPPVTWDVGPMIEVSPGDTTLTINLLNCLSEPVSIVIPGQPAVLAPFRDVDGRVKSFTARTNPGLTGTYTWINPKAGTYLYQSGTHPAKQVQMGLYGGVKIDAAAGTAYPGVTYNSEVILFYSEIDPKLHDPTPATAQPLNYKPEYFLINGKPYEVGDPPLNAGDVNQNVLIRFLNAGLKTHVPTLLGSYMSVIAEDGNLSPYVKEQYSVFLPAGKTMDAIFIPATPGTYPVYDASHHLTTDGATGGGMLTNLLVGGTTAAPIANNDSYDVVANGTLNVSAPGVLGNDTGTGPLTAALVSGPNYGTLTLNANGSFTYDNTSTPPLGHDMFQYTANNAGGASVAATVTINVITNTAPVANDQAVTTNEDTAVAITLTATDVDVGNVLTYSIIMPPMNGTLTGTPPNVTYTPALNYNGPDSFTFKANDGLVDSNIATVSITVNPVNDAPMAVDDFAETPRNITVVIWVTNNDSDPDGTIDLTSISIVTQPTRGGTVVVNSNGSVTYTPKKNFRGTDVFTYTVKDNLGELSNIATVRVNVLR